MTTKKNPKNNIYISDGYLFIPNELISKHNNLWREIIKTNCFLMIPSRDRYLKPIEKKVVYYKCNVPLTINEQKISCMAIPIHWFRCNIENGNYHNIWSKYMGFWDIYNEINFIDNRNFGCSFNNIKISL